MPGAVPFIAQAESAASSGTSRTVDVSGFTSGPVAQIIISSAATVVCRQSLDGTNWTSLLSVTSSDSLELDPRGVYYSFTWSGNNGNVTILIGPGLTAQGLANVQVPAVKSQTPS